MKTKAYGQQIQIAFDRPQQWTARIMTLGNSKTRQPIRSARDSIRLLRRGANGTVTIKTAKSPSPNREQPRKRVPIVNGRLYEFHELR